MTEETIKRVTFFCAAQHCTEPATMRVDHANSFLTACAAHGELVKRFFPIAKIALIEPGYTMPEGYEALVLERHTVFDGRTFTYKQVVGGQRIPCPVCRGSGHKPTTMFGGLDCPECGGKGYKA